MSLWRPKVRKARSVLALGVDSQQIAWLDDSAHAAGSPSTADHADGIARALASIEAAGVVDVIAANDVAQHWLQVPPSSTASFDELRLVAASRCAHLYGGSPGDWWVAADWDARRPFPCAALPRALVAPFTQQLEERGISARWHTAWGLVCKARARAFVPDGWGALRSPSRLMLWHCRSGELNRLTTLQLAPSATQQGCAERALQQIQLEALRSDDTSQGPLHWLDLADSATEPIAPEVDVITEQVLPADWGATSEAVTALGLASLVEGGAR